MNTLFDCLFVCLFWQEKCWVGLRPARSSGCCLQSEWSTRIVVSNQQDTPPMVDSTTTTTHDEQRGATRSHILVVHCYGHGGGGVTLSMGCAIDIVNNHLSALFV